MSSFLAVIGTIIVVEVVYRLRLKYRQCGIEIVTTVTESVETLRSKTIPDSSKEKELRRYAVKLFIQSLILFGLLLLTVFWKMERHGSVSPRRRSGRTRQSSRLLRPTTDRWETGRSTWTWQSSGTLGVPMRLQATPHWLLRSTTIREVTIRTSL